MIKKKLGMACTMLRSLVLPTNLVIFAMNSSPLCGLHVFPGGFPEKLLQFLPHQQNGTGTADISDIKTHAESKMIGMNHECK